MFESIEGFFVIAETCFSIARQYADRETDLVDCHFWMDELRCLIENEFPRVPFVPESDLELKREKFQALKREFVDKCEDVQLADWIRKEKLKSKQKPESNGMPKERLERPVPVGKMRVALKLVTDEIGKAQAFADADDSYAAWGCLLNVTRILDRTIRQS